MHPLYITSFFELGNEPEPALHGNDLRTYPVDGWIIDYHYELRDSGPQGTGELNK